MGGGIPPMGGSAPPMGGPGMDMMGGGMGAGTPPQQTDKIKAYNVWSVLEKILK
jgi:hypothetical protein